MNGWITCFSAILILNLQFVLGYEVSQPNTEEPDEDLSNFIFNGNTAREGQFPQAVALRNSTGTVRCSGTIIHQKWVLTAAHCFRFNISEGEYFATVGDVELLPLNQSRSVHNVTQVKLHPVFISDGLNKTRAWDIALVKVEPDFEFDGKFINKAPVVNFKVRVGQRCRIFGWGFTEPKPRADKKLLQYMNAEVVTVTNDSTFHYIDPNKKASTCPGDSGAGLMCRRFVVAAHSARNSRKCGSGTKSAGAGVYKVRSWIEKVIEDKLDRSVAVTRSSGSSTRAYQFFVPILIFAPFFRLT